MGIMSVAPGVPIRSLTLELCLLFLEWSASNAWHFVGLSLLYSNLLYPEQLPPPKLLGMNSFSPQSFQMLQGPIQSNDPLELFNVVE